MTQPRPGDALSLAAILALVPAALHLRQGWSLGTPSYRAGGLAIVLGLATLLGIGMSPLAARAGGLLSGWARRAPRGWGAACVGLTLLAVSLGLSSQLALLALGTIPLLVWLGSLAGETRWQVDRPGWRAHLTLVAFLLGLTGLELARRTPPALAWTCAGQGLLALVWLPGGALAVGGLERRVELMLPALTTALCLATSGPPTLCACLLVVHTLLMGLIRRGVWGPRALLWLLLPLAALGLARLRTRPTGIDPRGQELLRIHEIPPGWRVEQDFPYDPADWRLRRLLEDPEVELYLRVVGEPDPARTQLWLGGEAQGPLAPLTVPRPPSSLYGIPHAWNTYLRLPKLALHPAAHRLTVALASQAPLRLAYGNGLHPLPRAPHCRLIDPAGRVTDLSAAFVARRFRLQWALYLVSTRHHGPDGAPLVLGALY